MGFIVIERPIIEEKKNWRLLANDWDEDPSFYKVMPKKVYRKMDWCARCLKHLQAFSEDANITGVPRPEGIIHQTGQALSFYYLDGYVRLKPETGEVYVQAAHPHRDVTVHNLVRLAGMEKKQGPPIGGATVININNPVAQ